MGERYYSDLLEELDRAFPKYVKYHNLEQNHDMGVIIDLINNDLVEIKHKNSPPTTPSQEYRLNPKSFTLINQVRIKKATDRLNKSLKEFDKSSSKTAKRMEWLSIAMLVIALVQVIIQILN